MAVDLEGQSRCSHRHVSMSYDGAKRLSESFVVRLVNAARVRDPIYARTPQIDCTRVSHHMSLHGTTTEWGARTRLLS